MTDSKTNVNFDLGGKVAMVTGGNGGIGKALAAGLMQKNASVAIVGRNQDKLSQAVAELKQCSQAKVIGVQADLAEEEAVKQAMAQTAEQLGGLDILVNNAGVNIRKMPQDYDMAEWDHVIAVNLRAPFMCAKYAYPLMKAAGGGKIINIGSLTSILGGAKLAPYGATKAAIVQLSKTLAAAWATDNIQVNAILPGWINTELTIQARKDIPGLNEKAINRTPAGRWGETEDLVGAAVFFASGASDFVTGTALPVDGGFSIFLV